MLWGLSLSFWDSVFFWATVIAACAGAISVTSAFISAFVRYRITDVIQRESNIGSGAFFQGVLVSVKKESTETFKSWAKLLIERLNSEGIVTNATDDPFVDDKIPFAYTGSGLPHPNGEKLAPIKMLIGTKP